MTFRALALRHNEGFTLETSAFQIFRGGNSTFMNSFDEIQFLFYNPTEAAPQFL